MLVLRLSYSEARANLARVWDRVVQNREAAVLSRRGREDVVIVAASEFRGLVESAHLLRFFEDSARVTHGSLYLADASGANFRLAGHVGPAPVDQLDSLTQRLTRYC